ncbi:MAG: hypothetical protein H6538_08115 [Bacteroidales bacterium]|nr:hypothetical protein [Bacteroidales bacterium]
MNTILTILQQGTTSAIFEILLLLLVAAIIGYLTSYFYYKAIYTRKINVLENEKAQLKGDIERLLADKTNLETQVKEKEAEIVALKKPKK